MRPSCGQISKDVERREKLSIMKQQSARKEKESKDRV